MCSEYSLSTSVGIVDPHRHASGDYYVQKYFFHGEYSLSSSVGIVDPHKHATSVVRVIPDPKPQLALRKTL